MSTQPDLQAIHDTFVALAFEAGKMITSATPTRAGTGEKKNSADLVTETDQAVERLISDRLTTLYPTYAFMGEETFNPDDPASQLSDDPTFIVDPIDGTNNFFHSYPYVAVSLGFAIKKVPVVGVVYNPFTRDMYTGMQGGGSFLTRLADEESRNPSLKQGPNNPNSANKQLPEFQQRLPLKHPEPFKDLSTCLIAVEHSNDRSGNDYDVKCNTFRNLAAAKSDGGAMVHGLRSFGSAELNICAVAAGWLDLYWEYGTWAWDIAAAGCILQEAGGRLVGSMPGDWNPVLDQRRHMAVRAGENSSAIIEEVWSHVAGLVQVGYDTVSRG